MLRNVFRLIVMGLATPVPCAAEDTKGQSLKGLNFELMV